MVSCPTEVSEQTMFPEKGDVIWPSYLEVLKKLLVRVTKEERKIEFLDGSKRLQMPETVLTQGSWS